jgi:DNA-binding ferritin-like protein (Dps family)
MSEKKSEKMSEFFDNYLNLKKIMEGKREYKEHMARVKALPNDYQYVFEKIQKYMWMQAAGSGYDMMKLHYDLLELFEAGAAGGKGVLEITGDDVAAFSDELLRSARTYTEDWREKLNSDIMKKLGKPGGAK